MFTFKNLIILMIVTGFIALTVYESAAQGTDLDKGRRFLKLGNTYRENGDIENASKFLSEGKALVQKKNKNSFESKYWTAVAYEYFGYMYRDMGVKDNSKDWICEAINYLKKAVNIYNDIIKMRDGSQSAVNTILNNIDELTKTLETMIDREESMMPIAGLTNLRFEHAGLKSDDIDMNTISPDLVNLNFAGNKLKEIPCELHTLKKLRYLNLSANGIREVDCCIEDFQTLHWLDLADNKIRELPDCIGLLQNLKELNLRNNNLKTLPIAICNMRNLQILDLRGNPKIDDNVLDNVRGCLKETVVLFSPRPAEAGE